MHFLQFSHYHSDSASVWCIALLPWSERKTWYICWWFDQHKWIFLVLLRWIFLFCCLLWVLFSMTSLSLHQRYMLNILDARLLQDLLEFCLVLSKWSFFECEVAKLIIPSINLWSCLVPPFFLWTWVSGERTSLCFLLLVAFDFPNCGCCLDRTDKNYQA